MKSLYFSAQNLKKIVNSTEWESKFLQNPTFSGSPLYLWPLHLLSSPTYSVQSVASLLSLKNARLTIAMEPLQCPSRRSALFHVIHFFKPFQLHSDLIISVKPIWTSLFHIATCTTLLYLPSPALFSSFSNTIYSLFTCCVYWFISVFLHWDLKSIRAEICFVHWF